MTIIVWFPIGFVLLATKRYYVSHWLCMHIAHLIIGLGVTVVMVVSCFQVYSYANWTQATNPHGILGLIAYILSIFVSVTGIIAAAM